jgi:hypothetical protein
MPVFAADYFRAGVLGAWRQSQEHAPREAHSVQPER